jgi:hypothetical protein
VQRQSVSLPGDPARSGADSGRTSFRGRRAICDDEIAFGDRPGLRGLHSSQSISHLCKQQRAFGSWTHEGHDALQVVDGAELDNNAALAAT